MEMSMKKIIRSSLASMLLIMGVTLVPLAASVGAVNVFEKGCPGGSAPTASGADGSSSGGATICGATSKDKAQDIVKTVINSILLILGMIAVVMIVIGGIRYTTSNGDASNVKAAKDTILYAVVGLVVALLAYAIVNFVLGRFSTT